MAKGAKRLAARLAKIPLQVRAAAATEALLAAQRLGQLIAAAAPVDEGDLRASVRVEGGARGDRFYVKAGGPTTTKPVRKGQSATYDAANAVEFGTQKMKAREFFYPTYRANKKHIRAGLEHEIRKAVAKFNGQGSE
ncbi:phage protein, HK97 gp10 family [Bosea lathyri]|uniref:Phage protein, HK97 gp10 family n=2 Tax=Bosea lathyri TaxID=1036778 RepID=A0A1H6BFI3_9HYPH|nr:phage protein, HK97 gp10 family [Bosea lathyri]